MDATIIIAIVPVVLLVAYIVWLVRAKITEGRDIDLREPITGVVICLVAVLIIGSMTASTVTYTYSEDTNTLYINQNLIDRNQPFDSYGDEVKSVVIGNNARVIESGTLDSLTNLEYVSIGDDVEVRQGAFAFGFEDIYGETTTSPAGDYVNLEGVMCEVIDKGLLRYSKSDSIYSVTGFATGVTGVKNLVFPMEGPDGTLNYLGYNAFKETGLERVGFMPETSITAFSASVFYSCTSLRYAELPDGLADITSSLFTGCSALESVEIPSTVTTISGPAFQNCSSLEAVDLSGTSIESIASNAFNGCTSMTSCNLPSTVKTINGSAFLNCSSLEDVSIPDSVTTLGYRAYEGCTGVESVYIGTGLASVESFATFQSWTFYASDGTTLLTKNGANLAGKTFQGTAAALIEVAPGALSLSPDQIQMVHLHDAELQDLKDQISFDPLPFQPSLQTQEQEPVSA